MLRHAENVGVRHDSGMFSGKGRVVLRVGKKSYVVTGKISRAEFQRALDVSANYPWCFGQAEGRAYWLFGGRWYWDNDGLRQDQVYALLVTRAQRERVHLNRAQAIVAMQQTPTRTPRGAIPGDLKQYVWQRDGGCCRQCGSNVELQFDHIIPVAFGGATSAENLQLLCGPCNRRKGAAL